MPKKQDQKEPHSQQPAVQRLPNGMSAFLENGQWYEANEDDEVDQVDDGLPF